MSSWANNATRHDPHGLRIVGLLTETTHRLGSEGSGKRSSPVLDHAAVSDLVRVAGDQGRLGGLLKLWLMERPGRGASETEVHRLLNRIDELQSGLADIVARV